MKPTSKRERSKSAHDEREIEEREKRLQEALYHLRMARDALVCASAPRAAHSVRRALKSTDGAIRHNRNLSIRILRSIEAKVNQ